MAWRELNFLPNKQNTLQSGFFSPCNSHNSVFKNYLLNYNCSENVLTNKLHQTVFLSNLTSRTNKEGHRQRLLLFYLSNFSICCTRTCTKHLTLSCMKSFLSWRDMDLTDESLGEQGIGWTATLSGQQLSIQVELSNERSSSAVDIGTSAV